MREVDGAMCEETIKKFVEKFVEKLKDAVNGKNVDAFVEAKIIAEKTAKEMGAEL